MVETWKPVPYRLYAKSYQVSNTGKVRSIDRVIKAKDGSTRTISGKELSPRKSTNQQLFIELCISPDGHRIKRTCCIKRLVAECFVERPQGVNMVVTNIDRDYTNNVASNLKWISQSDINIRTMREHPENRNIVANIYANYLKEKQKVS